MSPCQCPTVWASSAERVAGGAGELEASSLPWPVVGGCGRSQLGALGGPECGGFRRLDVFRGSSGLPDECPSE